MSGLINSKQIFNLVAHVMHNFALKFAQVSLIRILSLCDVVCSGKLHTVFNITLQQEIRQCQTRRSRRPFNGISTTDPTIRQTFM